VVCLTDGVTEAMDSNGEEVWRRAAAGLLERMPKSIIGGYDWPRIR
jgi:serine phosphatase RsbU (regulator of sigma subunit)